MTTISLSYNEHNSMAQKTIDYIMSLGLFKATKTDSPAKKKTLKAIHDARNGKNMTTCQSFEEYLKAVAE